MMPMPMGGQTGTMPPAVAMPTPEQLEQDKLLANACTWEEISGILRSDERRNYSMDIETTATAFDDDEAEKKQRTEFIGTITQFFQFWGPVMQGNPTTAPFVKELLMFGIGAFKVGRSMEEVIEDAFDQFKSLPPQPNPEAEAQKAEQQLNQQKLLLEARKMQGEQQRAMAESQANQAKAATEQKTKLLDAQAKQEQMVHERDIKAREIAIKEAELALKAKELQARDGEQQMAMERHNHDLAMGRADIALRHQESQSRQQDMAAKHQDMMERRSMDQQSGAQSHALKMREMEAQGVSAEGQGMSKPLQMLAKEIAQAFSQISEQQQEAFGQISEQQQQIAAALSELSGHAKAPTAIARS